MNSIRILLLLGILGIVCSSRSEIKLKSNGYEGIVVAIGRDVKEDAALIEKIKVVFTDGSKYLFQATKRKTFFKDVTIVVPGTWSKSSKYGKPNGQSFDNANVLIDIPNGAYGNRPYTQQTKGCGLSGDFIHFTPEFLTNVDSQEIFGPLGKALLHEWGHLRWGLFDEYPSSKNFPIYTEKEIEYLSVGQGSPFYQFEKDILPIGCTKDVKGRPKNQVTQNTCKVLKDPLRIEKDCRFFPDKRNTAKASLMYLQFLESVTDFCDDGTLGEDALLHNRYAPNKHNQKCRGRSAWEIMREYQDFNGTKAVEIKDTTPSFSIVQETPMKIIILLDVNKSLMENGGTPLRLLRQSTRNFIMNIVPNDAAIGIVTFGNKATVLANLTTVSNRTDREKLLNAIPSTADDTDRKIARGLEISIKLLNEDGNGKLSNCYILLVTNGEKGIGSEPLRNAYSGFAGSLVIDTITLGNESIPEVTAASKDTGGLSFFASAGSYSTELFGAMAATILERRNTAIADPPILIENHGFQLHDIFPTYDHIHT